MARREWADKKALKFWHGHRGGLSDYGAKLLMMEHARAVRIVKARIKGMSGAMPYQWEKGYHQACIDILAALTKGRA